MADMFLDFTAGPAKGIQGPISVVGESQDKTYSKTIEVKSFDLSVENPTTIGSTSGGAGAGKVQFKPFKVTHVVDSGSPSLFQALALGAHFPTVKFLVRRSGGASPSAYLAYTFSMVFITNLDTAMSSGDEAPVETVTMVYGAVQVNYQPTNPTGQLGQAVTATWSQVTNSPSLTIPGN